MQYRRVTIFHSFGHNHHNLKQNFQVGTISTICHISLAGKSKTLPFNRMVFRQNLILWIYIKYTLSDVGRKIFSRNPGVDNIKLQTDFVCLMFEQNRQA